jgi:hypothetical protein
LVRDAAAALTALGEFLELESSPLDLTSLKTLGEINSGQTLHAGGAVNLTTREWFDRWQRFRAEHPDHHQYHSAMATEPIRQ